MIDSIFLAEESLAWCLTATSVDTTLNYRMQKTVIYTKQTLTCL